MKWIGNIDEKCETWIFNNNCDQKDENAVKDIQSIYLCFQWQWNN